MKKTLTLTLLLSVCLLVVCSLAACSPTAGDVPAEAFPTPGSEYPSPPQPSDPAVNGSKASPAIDALDLQALAILDGDLPPGYKSGQVLAQLPNLFDGIPVARQTFYQLFEHEGSGAGGVAILLYDQPDQAQLAYDHLLQGMGVDESRCGRRHRRASPYLYFLPTGSCFPVRGPTLSTLRGCGAYSLG